MRDWSRHELYIDKLIGDIYPQPEPIDNDQHGALALKVINHWMSRLTACDSVLDVGCGTGFAQDYFQMWDVEYEGICLGEDYLEAQKFGRNVKKMDFSFLDYDDNSFDLIFSRHSLEHSPMPLLTLMEWHRVSRQWLGLVLPTPDWYGVKGSPNHYFVLNQDQWENVLEAAGWHVIWSEVDSLPQLTNGPLKPHEIWLFAEKVR